MKQHPILFNTQSMRAILEGRKTQTRRVVKPQPRRSEDSARLELRDGALWWTGLSYSPIKPSCPYGVQGDHLWVRETWAMLPIFDQRKPLEITRLRPILYRADDYIKGQFSFDKNWLRTDFGKWRPSIHMPRWASRTTLEVLDVRVERIQDISEEDIEAEGIVSPDPVYHPTIGAYEAFEELWNGINAKRGFGWDTNCWCWCISFTVIGGSE